MRKKCIYMSNESYLYFETNFSDELNDFLKKILILETIMIHGKDQINSNNKKFDAASLSNELVTLVAKFKENFYRNFTLRFREKHNEHFV